MEGHGRLRAASLSSFFLLAFAASCGGKIEQEPVTNDGDSRAGFVTCGERACDVGSGNQCYACGGTQTPIWQCHSLDLPTQCADPITIVRRECDGHEDCRAGTICVKDAYGALLCR